MWLLRERGEPLVGTLVLVVGMAVPVLAVTATPARCGGVVLRGWAMGVVLALALVGAARLSSAVTPPVLVLVSTACVVVLAVVVSAMPGKGE